MEFIFWFIEKFDYVWSFLINILFFFLSLCIIVVVDCERRYIFSCCLFSFVKRVKKMNVFVGNSYFELNEFLLK